MSARFPLFLYGIRLQTDTISRNRTGNLHALQRFISNAKHFTGQLGKLLLVFLTYPDTHLEIYKYVVNRPSMFRARICNLQKSWFESSNRIFYQNEGHSYIVSLNTIVIL